MPKELINLLNEDPGSWDLPELPEIGTVLSESGLISDAQNLFAQKFQANKCWFGVNGASGLIQSAILSMAKPGESILIPRNAHISVIKICLLCDIFPIFYNLEFSVEKGCYLPLNQSQLKENFQILICLLQIFPLYLNSNLDFCRHTKLQVSDL